MVRPDPGAGVEEAGLPKGVINLIMGDGSKVGNVIVEDPRVKAISFTGSNAVGQRLYAQAPRSGCAASSSSSAARTRSSCWRTPTSKRRRLTSCLGAFGSSGQRCTATSRAVVVEPILERFTELVADRAEQIVTGDGLEPGVTMGPIVDDTQRDSVLEYIKLGQDEGATLVIDGTSPSRPALGDGYFIEPTIFVGVKPEDDESPRKRSSARSSRSCRPRTSRTR